jgi:hypothetical protein
MFMRMSFVDFLFKSAMNRPPIYSQNWVAVQPAGNQILGFPCPKTISSKSWLVRLYTNPSSSAFFTLRKKAPKETRLKPHPRRTKCVSPLLHLAFESSSETWLEARLCLEFEQAKKSCYGPSTDLIVPTSGESQAMPQSQRVKTLWRMRLLVGGPPTRARCLSGESRVTPQC